MCDEVGVYDRVEEVVVHHVIDVRILVIVIPKKTHLVHTIREFIIAGTDHRVLYERKYL